MWSSWEKGLVQDLRLAPQHRVPFWKAHTLPHHRGKTTRSQAGCVFFPFQAALATALAFIMLRQELHTNPYISWIPRTDVKFCRCSPWGLLPLAWGNIKISLHWLSSGVGWGESLILLQLLPRNFQPPLSNAGIKHFTRSKNVLDRWSITSLQNVGVVPPALF